MASNHHIKKPQSQSSSTTYFYTFTSIIILTTLFLLTSHYLTSTSSPLIIRIESINQYAPTTSSPPCDYSEGKWFYDPTVRSHRYDETCKEIYKGWNCISGNRSGAKEILKWRWQPNHCALPAFDPLRFLDSYRDISIGDLDVTSESCLPVLLSEAATQIAPSDHSILPIYFDIGDKAIEDTLETNIKKSVDSYMLYNKVKVYTSYPDMPLPKGTAVLPIAKNKWTIISFGKD